MPLTQATATVGGVPVGTLLDFAGATAPPGYLACDGTAVSRTTYALLFAVIGTTWGVGNGTSTFNVPDLRRRTTVGKGGTSTSGMGINVGDVGGIEMQGLDISMMPTHDHGAVTGNQNVNHTHSGTTSSQNANHQHSGVTAGMNSNNPHTHMMEGGLIFNTAGGGGSGLSASGGGTPQSPSSGLIIATDIDHTHNLTTSNENANHQHTITTGTESLNHQHAIGAQGGSAQHNNMQPSAVVTKIIRAGA